MHRPTGRMVGLQILLHVDHGYYGFRGFPRCRPSGSGVRLEIKRSQFQTRPAATLGVPGSRKHRPTAITTA